jgi:hypothetical protein
VGVRVSMNDVCRRDAVAGWARAASGAGNRGGRRSRRRCGGQSLGGRSLWSAAEAGSYQQQAEEAEAARAECYFCLK